MYKYYNHISMFFRGFARMQPPETIHFNRAFLAKNDGSCFYKVCWVRSSLSSDQHEAGGGRSGGAVVSRVEGGGGSPAPSPELPEQRSP